MIRQPPRTGSYPDAMMTLVTDLTTGKRWFPRFDLQRGQGITADQAREAAHLLNQLAEYLSDESHG